MRTAPAKRVLFAILLTLALGFGTARAGAASIARPARPVVVSLTAPHNLFIGTPLVSPNHAYSFVVQSDGALVEYEGRRVVDVVHAADRRNSPARLALQPNGELVELVRTTIIWRSYTAGSGSATRLTLGNDGTLRLENANGLVWSAALGNSCTANTAARALLVSIGQQRARACSGPNQLLITPVTTGASALGAGTPLGSYRINSKVQNTRLYPAAGGVYAVRYWLPYDGNTYGIHDSPWQTFPYGSGLYQIEGSHGCIHMPRPALDWFFLWAQIGTTVTIAD